MNWLLIALILAPSSDGGLGEPRVLYKAFPLSRLATLLVTILERF